MENINPPSYWYSLPSNREGVLCELLRLEECIFISMFKICGIIRQKYVYDKLTITIQKDQRFSFIVEYELGNFKFNLLKLKIHSDNSSSDSRKGATFIRIDGKILKSYS